jgi:hypothetical protein
MKTQQSQLYCDRPDFEIISGHDFTPKEKVFLIDQNDYDIWEGIMTSIKHHNFTTIIRMFQERTKN